MVGRDFAANKGAAGMDYALLLFFAEKWVANEGKNGVKGEGYGIMALCDWWQNHRWHKSAVRKI